MKMNPSSGFSAVHLLFGIALGCCCGLSMASYCLTLAAQFPWPLMLLITLAALLCLALALIFQLLAHELGHLLFGLLSGYRFVSFRFSPRLLAQCGLVCRCVMDPPKLDKDGAFPITLYSLGGIILNMLFGLFFLWLYFISGGAMLLTLFALPAGILGLGLGLMYALPLGQSDGYNALWLSDDEQALYAHWLRLREDAAQEQQV